MSTNVYQYDGGDRSSAKRIHIFSVGYIVLLYVSLLTLESFEIIPYLFRESWSYYIHLGFFIYCMVNIGSYYYAVLRTDVSCGTVVQNSRHAMKPGSFFCQSCQQNSPPRSHHCGLCGSCIERRDHHCYFIANCIGQANLSYFIALNIWAGILTIYCLSINLVYLNHNILPLSPITVEGILQLVPVVTIYKYCVGSIALFHLTVVIVTWMTFVQILVSFVCGGFQARLLVTGQTTYEFSHQVLTYDHGWQNNYEDICGKYWYILWLFPTWPRKSKKVDSSEENGYYYSGKEEDYPRKVDNYIY